MLLSVFTPAYEVFLGVDHNNPEYHEGIFSSVGIISIIGSIIISLVFYLALGRWKPVFHKATHWIITLVFTCGLGFILAYTLACKEIGSADSYVSRFAFINALYMVVCFMILSCALKRFSIFAKHTPF